MMSHDSADAIHALSDHIDELRQAIRKIRSVAGKSVGLREVRPALWLVIEEALALSEQTVCRCDCEPDDEPDEFGDVCGCECHNDEVVTCDSCGRTGNREDLAYSGQPCPDDECDGICRLAWTDDPHDVVAADIARDEALTREAEQRLEDR